VFSTLMSRVLGAPDSPTADLYFRNACADFLARGVEQLAPTVFASDAACLVMRHDMRAGRLPSRRRLIYLIDDDVDAGTTDESLPFFYRQKLRMVECARGRRIRRFAGVAVVSSPVLARLFAPVTDTRLVRPYWSEPMAGLDHFQDSGAPGSWIDMAYLGSAVHRTDLEFLLPAVERLLAAHSRLRFHLPARHRLPARLEAHPRIRRIPGTGWTAYRHALAGRRFHIALYPLMDTPFNRGRSPNKLIEHAIVGAAPVYSTSWAEGTRAAEEGAGLCLPNDGHAWHAGIAGLIGDAARMQRIAAGAQALGRRLNDPRPQRKLWRELLELKEPALV